MEQEMSKVWLIIGIIGAIAMIYIGIAGFGDDNAISNNSPEKSSGEQKKTEAEVKLEEITGKQLDAVPGSPEAPAQSNSIQEGQISANAIKIAVSDAGFLPAAFTVKAGELVTLAITATDTRTHIFKFDSPDLAGIAVGVGPGETREIPFVAPNKRGEYTFHCDVPGHRSRGETGVMVIQ